jgi:hypothetical protein
MAGISATGMQEAITHIGLVIPSESLGTRHLGSGPGGGVRVGPPPHFPRSRSTPVPDGSDRRLIREFAPRFDLATARPTRGLPGVPRAARRQKGSFGCARADSHWRNSLASFRMTICPKTSAAHGIRHPLRRFPRPKRPANILRGLLLPHGLKHRGFNLLRFPGQP